MKQPAIVFIGAGKIAQALIGGLVKGGYTPNSIWASCPTQAQLNELSTQLGICTTTENTVAAAHADVLVLAVKPYLIVEVLTDLRAIIATRKPLIISVAAGITESTMRVVIGDDIPLVRAMPNTPASVGCSMTALYIANPSLSIVKEQAEAIFKAIGATLWIEDESHINAITAVSGSGPAYFFLLMEALENTAISFGLSREVAHQLTIETAMGSACLAAHSDESLKTLYNNLAVKGGGTEQAVQVLKSRQFAEVLHDAVVAAKRRYDELSA